MFNKIINTYGLFYPKKQKLLYQPNIKLLGEAYSEINKEKKHFYFKHYKTLLKLKLKKNIYFKNSLHKPILNKKVSGLNLTPRKVKSYKVLSDHSFYNDLKKTKIKIKKLAGYSQYYDKVFY